MTRELASLKVAHKCIAAYTGVLDKADKMLNKPKKRSAKNVLRRLPLLLKRNEENGEAEYQIR